MTSFKARYSSYHDAKGVKNFLQFIIDPVRAQLIGKLRRTHKNSRFPIGNWETTDQLFLHYAIWHLYDDLTPGAEFDIKSALQEYALTNTYFDELALDSAIGKFLQCADDNPAQYAKLSDKEKVTALTNILAGPFKFLRNFLLGYATLKEFDNEFSQSVNNLQQ